MQGNIITYVVAKDLSASNNVNGGWKNMTANKMLRIKGNN
jgi:hypothetical protein